MAENVRDSIMEPQMHLSPTTKRFEKCNAHVRKCPYPHISRADYERLDYKSFSSWMRTKQGVRLPKDDPRVQRRTPGTGVNVDEAERKMKALIIAVAENHPRIAGRLARELYALPTENQFNIFKGTPKQSYLTAAENLVAKLREITGQEQLALIQSDDNHVGSDLEERNSGMSFELKFGAATDLNLGLNVLDDVLDGGLSHLLPSIEERKRWRRLYTAGRREQQTIEFQRKLNFAAVALAAREGERVTEAGQHRLTANYHGLTADQEIGGEDAPRSINRLHLTRTFGWDERARIALDEGGEWTLKQATLSENNRLRIVFGHGDATEIRFVYNVKNNIHLPNGEVIPAKSGVGAGAWNGWVTERLAA